MRRHPVRTVALLLLGAVALLAFWARTEWAGEEVCMLARKRLPALLGMEVGLGRCVLDPIRGQVELVGFSLTAPGNSEPLLAADRARVSVRAIDLLSGRLRLERLEVTHPRVRIDLSAGEKVSSGPGSGCFLDHLGRLEIDNLSINGAEVHLRGAGSRAVDLEQVDLDLKLTQHTYSIKLSVAQGQIDLGNVKLPLSRVRLSTALDLQEQKLTLNHLEVAAGEMAFFSRGEVENLCDPSLGLEASLYVPLDLVSAMLGPQAPRLSGSAALAIKRAEGSLRDPSLDIELTLAGAQVNQYEIGDAYLEARRDQGEVRIDKLDLSIGEGKAKVVGTIGLSAGFPVVASVDLEEVEFARLVDKLGLHHSWVNWTSSGHVEVKGQIAPFHLTGPASVDARDFRLTDRGFDRPEPSTLLQFNRAQVEVQADFNSERVHLARGRVQTEASDLDADAQLFFDPARGFDIDVVMRTLDLDDLGHLLGIPWSGKLEGKAALRIASPSPRIEGFFSGTDFKFHKLSLGEVEGSIRFEQNLLAFPAVTVLKGRSRFDAQGELEFGGPRGVVARGSSSFQGGRMSDLIDAVGGENWILELAQRMEARINGRAVVEGPLSGPRALINLSMAEVTYFDRQLGSGELVFRAEDGERIFIDRLDFNGPCGPIAFSGRFDLGRDMQFVLDAPRLMVSELAKPDGESLRAKGSLAVRARLFGPPEHTQMEGSVEVHDLTALGVDLGSGTLSLAADQADLSLKGPLGRDLLLDGRLVLAGEGPFALGVSADVRDLGRYLPSVSGIKGSLTAELLATGSIQRYRETRGDLSVSKLKLSKGDYLLLADEPIALSFDGGAVELKSLKVKGPSGARLSASGSKEADGSLALSIKGAVDSRLIESWTPSIEQAAGQVQIDANVTGTLDKPIVIGAAQLLGARFAVRGWPVSVRDLKGRIEFSQNRLYVADVDGVLNNGRAKFSGDVEMKGFVPRRMNLGLLLDEGQFRIPESVPSTLSGELRLFGPMDNLVLAGDMDVVRLRYTQDVDLQGQIADLKRRRLEAYAFEQKGEWVRFDVTVRLQEARIDNNVVKLALKGELKLVGNNVHTGLIGSLSSVEPGRGYFRGNEFSVNRVNVDFGDSERIAATIDVHAEAMVRDYKVNVHAFGPAEDPQVDLKADPELTRADVVTLLTVGFTKGEATTTTNAGAGLMGETLLSISGLDKGVRRFIPKNSFIRDFNFHLSTQYYDLSGTVEPTAQIESRVGSDSFKLSLSQPVISAKGRRAQAEYRFNEHLSAQAQWDSESSSSSSLGDLGLDLRLRWERE
jgi:translocation and assembly module TamB